VAGGAVGVVATILAGVQTFLDLGGRAERHRHEPQPSRPPPFDEIILRPVSDPETRRV
jgi:hypothetical protein